MPHLRFTRDKRGYENTYVVHSVRRRGKARQRVLYWFRTPPNIRIGRAALDEEAIRLIEEHNPDIEFDWGKILEAQPPPPAPEPQERRRRLREETRDAAGAQGPQDAPSAAPSVASGFSRPSRESSHVAPPPVASGFSRISSEGAPGAAGRSVTVAPDVPVAPETPLASAPIEPVAPEVLIEADAVDVPDAAEIEPPALVPVTVYHGGADVLVTATTDEVPRMSPVEARLGSEQLGRVRARYAEILARISERAGGDPIRLEEMRKAAEVLNPDSWVTEKEIVSGLQHFDARLGEIRGALGIKRRRRSRRGGRRRRGRGDRPALAAPSEMGGQTPAAGPGEPVEMADGGADELPEDEENPTD